MSPVAGLYLILLFALFSLVNSARILAVVPTPSYSHQVAFRPIWRELSLRGHQVTLITTDPIEDPSLTNLTEIDIRFSYDIMRKHNYHEKLMEIGHNYFKFIKFFISVYKELNEIIFSYPPVRNIIDNPNVEYDLVMIEYLNPLYFGFSHRFNTSPFIGILSLESSYLGHDCFGNPSHPAVNPDVFLPIVPNTSKFYVRFVSTVLSVLLRLFSVYHMKNTDISLAKFFGPDYPSAKDLACKADLLFLSSNPNLDIVRATVPAVINIGGGMHVHQSKPLPKHLQEYLDSSKNGVIYFSLGGTNVQSKMIPESLKSVIKATFAELPYDILWKYEDTELPGKPDNVRIEKWLPQQDVLRHPKIKLFISQGGLQSIEEAIFSHVPILGMPFFGDQNTNVKKLVNKELGLEVDRENLDKDTFKAAILELINNPKYKANVKKVADLSLDQPMTGLEKAIWWTEYVLRHKGAQHLKGPAAKVPWYQYFLLDVIGFCAAVIITVTFISVKLVKFLYRQGKRFCCKSKVKTN